ncbi:hypothetical protein [Vogesella indigofera]|uniref:hypothetical protein n=1 Tax=Vogesella indigofera TaxID=45465 RepID=UPI0035B08B32
MKVHPGFCLIVLVPTIISTLYFAVIASERYVSEAQLTIKQAQGAPNLATMGLAALLNSTGAAHEDVHFLKQHIMSLDMLNNIEKDLGYRNAVSGQSVDFLSRLGSESSQEQALDYYRKHVVVEVDETNGILTLKTQGFSPDYAYRLNRYLVMQSEQFINGLSHKIANDQVAFVEHQLADARKRLEMSKQKLIGFQNKYGMLSPTEQAKATAALVLELQNALAQAETEYRALTAYIESTAPQATALQQKINAIKVQLQSERDKVAGSGAGKLNTLAAGFMELEFNAEFAQEVVKSSLAALEKTRVEAAQKLKHVSLISAPHIAEDAEYPRRLYNISAILIFSLVGYWIARLLHETIMDHRD